MREAFTDAIERGVHLLSFSANAFHWKVELLKDPSGHDVMMLEKRGSTDLWRTQISGTRLSEQCLFGAQYPLNPAGYGGPEAPFLTEPRSGPDAPPSEDLMSHWIFEGTGLAFGERIDGLMYGEVDSFHPDHPYPDVIDQIVTVQS